jgi:hypothetical protein
MANLFLVALTGCRPPLQVDDLIHKVDKEAVHLGLRFEDDIFSTLIDFVTCQRDFFLRGASVFSRLATILQEQHRVALVSILGRPRRPMRRGVSIYKHVTQEPEELNTHEGETVFIIDMESKTLPKNWWLARSSRGTVGLIPSSYVRLDPLPEPDPIKYSDERPPPTFADATMQTDPLPTRDRAVDATVSVDVQETSTEPWLGEMEAIQELVMIARERVLDLRKKVSVPLPKGSSIELSLASVDSLRAALVAESEMLAQSCKQVRVASMQPYQLLTMMSCAHTHRHHHHLHQHHRHHHHHHHHHHHFHHHLHQHHGHHHHHHHHILATLTHDLMHADYGCSSAERG